MMTLLAAIETKMGSWKIGLSRESPHDRVLKGCYIALSLGHCFVGLLRSAMRTYLKSAAQTINNMMMMRQRGTLANMMK
jgi:hypothetical protein